MAGPRPCTRRDTPAGAVRSGLRQQPRKPRRIRGPDGPGDRGTRGARWSLRSRAPHARTTNGDRNPIVIPSEVSREASARDSRSPEPADPSARAQPSRAVLMSNARGPRRPLGDGPAGPACDSRMRRPAKVPGQGCGIGAASPRRESLPGVSHDLRQSITRTRLKVVETLNSVFHPDSPGPSACVRSTR